jgi:hypothetical protein
LDRADKEFVGGDGAGLQASLYRHGISARFQLILALCWAIAYIMQKHTLADDEALARMLQFEEQQKLRQSLRASIPSAPRSSQEMRDLQLARQMAQMDMHDSYLGESIDDTQGLAALDLRRTSPRTSPIAKERQIPYSGSNDPGSDAPEEQSYLNMNDLVSYELERLNRDQIIDYSDDSPLREQVRQKSAPSRLDNDYQNAEGRLGQQYHQQSAMLGHNDSLRQQQRQHSAPANRDIQRYTNRNYATETTAARKRAEHTPSGLISAPPFLDDDNNNLLSHRQTDIKSSQRNNASISTSQSPSHILAKARGIDEAKSSDSKGIVATKSIPRSPRRSTKSSLHDSLEYARRMQEMAFKNLAVAQQQSNNRATDRQSQLEVDLELARKMQELENKGMGRLNSGRNVLDVNCKPNDRYAASDSRLDYGNGDFLEFSGSTVHDVEVKSPMSETRFVGDKVSTQSPLAKTIPSNRPLFYSSDGKNLVPSARINTSSSQSPTNMNSPSSRPGISAGGKSLAQSAPTNLAGRRLQQGTAATLPALDPLFLPDDTLFGGGELKKKRGFLGLRGNKKAVSLPSGAIAAGIPGSIPLPGGSMSAPISPSSVPCASVGSLLATPLTPNSNLPHRQRSWLPKSPLNRNRNGATQSIPSVGSNARLPSVSLSEKRGAATRHQTQQQQKKEIVICSSCHKTGGSFIVALGKRYHVGCFRCVACHKAIDQSDQFAFSTDVDGVKHPHHRKCYAEMFGIKCSVCRQQIPANHDGTVSFVKHPFFETEQMCTRHAEQSSRRCTGCHRFEPQNEPFADLNDENRCVCYACCRTVVVDNADVKPLWSRVLDFMEIQLGLQIWKGMRDIPILMVQSEALSDQMSSGNPHCGAAQIMARGLCLTDHKNCHAGLIRTPSMRFHESNSTFRVTDDNQEGFTYFDVHADGRSNTNSNVFAILCLSGLPRDLTTSILAHEAVHAWIKLNPEYNDRMPIPAQVEEGCAQLLAMLMLTDGLDPPQPASVDLDDVQPSDEKLRQYFKFSIEKDETEIYGTGYHKATAAYRETGIEALLSHVARHGEFPIV